MDWDSAGADKGQNAARVLGDVDDIDVAGEGGDGDKIDIGADMGEAEGEGIIHPRIDVEDEGDASGQGCHSGSL